MSIDYKSSNDPFHLLPENIKQRLLPEKLGSDLNPLEIDIKKLGKDEISFLSTSNLDADYFSLDKGDVYALEKILPSLIRTTFMGQILSVPYTAFYLGNQAPTQGLINKKHAQRYIGLAATKDSRKTFVVTDVYGSYMGSNDTFATQVNGEDDYVKVLDFVTRWPMNISLLRKKFRFSEAECVKNFGNYFMDSVNNLKYAPGSNVVLMNNNLLTYELSVPNVVSKVEYDYYTQKGVQAQSINSRIGGNDSNRVLKNSFIKGKGESESENENGLVNVYSPKFMGCDVGHGHIGSNVGYKYKEYGHNSNSNPNSISNHDFNVYSVIY